MKIDTQRQVYYVFVWIQYFNFRNKDKCFDLNALLECKCNWKNANHHQVGTYFKCELLCIVVSYHRYKGRKYILRFMDCNLSVF